MKWSAREHARLTRLEKLRPFKIAASIVIAGLSGLFAFGVIVHVTRTAPPWSVITDGDGLYSFTDSLGYKVPWESDDYYRALDERSQKKYPAPKPTPTRWTAVKTPPPPTPTPERRTTLSVVNGSKLIWLNVSTAPSQNDPSPTPTPTPPLEIDKGGADGQWLIVDPKDPFREGFAYYDHENVRLKTKFKPFVKPSEDGLGWVIDFTERPK